MPRSATTKPRHVCLVDGSGFIFRAFHALPPLSRPDGTQVGAVLGFINMLLRLRERAECDHLAVIFDAGRRSFRNDIYPEYKAHRPEPPPELVPQFALVRDATRAFNVPAIEQPGYEADDLIATYARLAREAGATVTIVSSDKDLMQLVRDGVTMLDPIKYRTIGEAEVREKFGVGPDKVVDVQALAGDSTDNVPGVPGIGVKTAAELINAYGDLDSLLAHVDEIKQPKRRETLAANRDKATISRQLVKLKDDLTPPAPLDSFAVRDPDPEKTFAFLREQNLRSVMQRLEQAGWKAPAAAVAAPPPPERAAEKKKHDGPARYVLVQDVKALDAWIARATAAGIVAVDTETTSLDPLRAELVGVSLAIEPGEACYVPVGHVAPESTTPAAGKLDFEAKGAKPPKAPKQLDRSLVLDKLEPLLADPAVLKIGHNLKYDMQIFAKAGLAVAPFDDTMLISYVLEGGLHGHGMDELAQLNLGHKTITYDEVTGSGKSRLSFAEVPLDRARDYAAEDAEVTLRLHHVLKPRLLAERLVTVYETIERPLAPVVRAMEANGIAVDRDELRRLSNDFANRLVDLEKQIHKLAGHAFNIGSPQQLGKVLFDEMGLELGDGDAPKKTKTGAYATGADVLEDLAASGHELPAKVLEWRQLSKLKSTYADALVDEINPATGRVHTSFALAATSTGRLSSSDPNLQNIPVRTDEGRKIRRAFVAAPGYELVSFDYSQIELRLLAHVADIAQLKAAFRDGIDIHALTASQVFGVPVKGMDPMVRRRAKAINFGIIYGISAFGLARQLSIPQGEARAYIDAYFKRYPGIRDYMERTKKEAQQNGYVLTPFGRRCHVPGIRSKNPAERNFSERAAINAPLQGGAADIIKRAMVRMPAALAKAKLGARMLLQVHDELLFEVAPKERAATVDAVKRAMEGAAAPHVALSVPLVVDVGHGRSWDEAH
ncbi:MAG TPA: DNA polymerase I [Alphaproteobacteria bacterium]|nr:DNA polymerase I [Alphaproteobacteria bacterium]